MSPHTNVRENTNQAEQIARTAATGTWMSRLARLGYATKGVVYLIIGGLAAQLAIGAWWLNNGPAWCPSDHL
jgi:hypothetical protein